MYTVTLNNKSHGENGTIKGYQTASRDDAILVARHWTAKYNDSYMIAVELDPIYLATGKGTEAYQTK